MPAMESDNILATIKKFQYTDYEQSQFLALLYLSLSFFARSRNIALVDVGERTIWNS
jgi:hypothetical protein